MNPLALLGAISIRSWAEIACVVALAVALVGVKVQTHRLGTAQAKLAQIDALGKAQKEQTDLQIERDKKEKERADNESKRRFADLSTRYKRLLDSNASLLPPAGPDTGGSERICFDRAKLGGSLGEFVAGVTGIAESGDRAVIGLDVAKAWATAPSRAP